MKTEIIKFLFCPRCHEALRVRNGDGESEIVTGQLECPNGHIYDIHRYVPRFIYNEQIDPRQEQTMKVFSTQWEEFGQVTIDETAFSISRDWLFGRYGWNNDAGVRKYLLDKNMILDAGSASGRYANYFAKLSGNTVFGVDIGAGVDIAQKNFGETNNVHYLQASITDLPFAPNTFDFIMSDGVIHHTTNPKDTFQRLTTFLKPGGEMAIYMYHVGNPLREMTDSYFIEAMAPKTMKENMEISNVMTQLAEELHNSGAKVTVPKRLDMLDIEPGEYTLFELIYWKIIKLYWDPNVPFNKNWSTNFGWFTPINAYRYTGEEIIGWFEELGFEIKHTDISQRGISIRALKL